MTLVFAARNKVLRTGMRDPPLICEFGGHDIESISTALRNNVPLEEINTFLAVGESLVCRGMLRVAG